MISNIRNRLSDPYRRGIILNYIFKIVGLLLSLLSVRITISYLGTSLYGLWVTLASVVSWMGSGDFGIGNGLRNQLAKAYGEGNKEKEGRIIATGLLSLGKIAIVLFFAICIISEILIQVNVLDYIVRLPMYITGAFFCLNLFLGVSNAISYAHQKSWYVTACGTTSTLLSIIFIITLQGVKIEANLVTFSIIHGVCLTIPNIVLIFVLRKNGVHYLLDGRRLNSDKTVLREIINVGLGFFGLQICAIILYSTDNVIINYLFDSESVTKYSVITKIYDTGQGLFSVLLISLWSAVTFQAARDNYIWIRKETKKLLKIWVVYSLGVIIVSLLINPIVKIWIGEKAAYYEPQLIFLFCIYGITISFSAIFVNIVNGLGKIKLQLILAIIGAVINIPLSIIFGKYCEMGLFGVKFATFISAIVCAIFIPIQVRNLLR